MRWSSSKGMWLTSGAHRLHHWHQPLCPLCTTNLAAMAMEIQLETDEVELFKEYVAHKWSPSTPSLAPTPCAPYAQQVWQQWQWRYHWRQMRWSSSKSMWLTSGAHRLHHWHQPPCPLCTTSLAAMAMEIPLEADEVELLKGYVAHKWSPPTPSLAPTPVPPMHNKSGSNGNGDTTGGR